MMSMSDPAAAPDKNCPACNCYDWRSMWIHLYRTNKIVRAWKCQECGLVIHEDEPRPEDGPQPDSAGSV